MKNRGLNLIELVVYVFLLLSLNFLVFNSYVKYLEKNRLDKQVILITSIFRKYQKYCEINSKKIEIYFNLEDKYILFEDKKLNLDKKYVYLSKNKEEKLKFIRRINENGNLSKGFSIILFDKKLNKLVEISFNSVNAMSYPIISIRYEI